MQVIRLGFDAISTEWSRLVGRPTAHHVEAVSTGVQEFTWLGTTVSCQAMCTGRRCHGVPQAPLCHSRTTRFSSVQNWKLWPTGILVCRPSHLELTARTSATNYFSRPFQALSENVFIPTDIALSASKTFCWMAYISLLTYLLAYISGDINIRDIKHQMMHRVR